MVYLKVKVHTLIFLWPGEALFSHENIKYTAATFTCSRTYFPSIRGFLY